MGAVANRSNRSNHMSDVANCKDFRLSGYRHVSISVKRFLVAPFFVAGPDIGDTIPVSGRTRVATFIAAVSSHFWKGVTLARVETNGKAAVLKSRYGVPVALATIDATAQVINQIMWIMRPSKLVAISKYAKDEASLTRLNLQSTKRLAKRPVGETFPRDEAEKPLAPRSRGSS
jgi:hypothetical protein